MLSKLIYIIELVLVYSCLFHERLSCVDETRRNVDIFTNETWRYCDLSDFKILF